jgi:VWFA-related protein
VVSNTQIERSAKLEELLILESASDSVRKFNQIRIDDLRLGLAALDASEQNLEQLTAATGGRLYKPASFRDLEKTFAEVADELRHQYALYYSPLNAKKDGHFRRVRVETSNPTHQITARIGYFAGKH